jgi:hypothetical protein
MKSGKRFLLASVLMLGAAYTSATSSVADCIQTNLVSDIPGFAAITDPALHNPWGISHTATSPIWTSNQGTGKSQSSLVPRIKVGRKSCTYSSISSVRYCGKGYSSLMR